MEKLMRPLILATTGFLFLLAPVSPAPGRTAIGGLSQGLPQLTYQEDGRNTYSGDSSNDDSSEDFERD
jgi:hypothetical protein